MFKLIFSENANKDMDKLESSNGYAKILKAVNKALAYLETNPRHPGLNTHEYHDLSQQYGVKIYEAYAQNNTPGAYRVFWHYGSDEKSITIIAVTPHP